MSSNPARDAWFTTHNLTTPVAQLYAVTQPPTARFRVYAKPIIVICTALFSQLGYIPMNVNIIVPLPFQHKLNFFCFVEIYF
jgi:hypothetical protein